MLQDILLIIIIIVLKINMYYKICIFTKSNVSPTEAESGRKMLLP